MAIKAVQCRMQTATGTAVVEVGYTEAPLWNWSCLNVEMEGNGCPLCQLVPHWLVHPYVCANEYLGL